ncbi:hypothetical protein KY361_06605 [Candidatus Woesearchaeota archaeon]|nr:hypothetical protein [Candidatus Woesearchaeota archaeon]
MVKTEDEIKRDIKNHMDKYEKKYSSWYIGVTEDPQRRLFDEHKVDEKKDHWIYSTAVSAEVARKIEKYFIEGLHVDGGKSGGDKDARVVYAYQKTTHTKP